MAFTLCRFLRKDVPQISSASFDATGTTDLEALGCASFGFHFWHLSPFFIRLSGASFIEDFVDP
jgi:hypothetical protein